MATITSPRTESPAGTIRVTSPTSSNTGTPSTSSIDLPRPENQPAPAATTQRRNRAALRDYYNLKNKPSPQPQSGNLSRSASIASTTSDSTITSHATNNASDGTSPLLAQLDDPSFQPQTFISNLLSSASLRDILRTESSLVSEIRNLDGERKALVYDNYSKLIKAVGTIGDMQRGMQKRSAGGDGGLDGVEGLQEKIAVLERNVKTLGPEDLDDEGKERRKRRKEKELVRWVLDAPERIEAMVEEGNREDAEMDFARVKRVVDEWDGVQGVDEVRKQCQSALSKSTRSSADG